MESEGVGEHVLSYASRVLVLTLLQQAAEPQRARKTAANRRYTRSKPKPTQGGKKTRGHRICKTARYGVG